MVEEGILHLLELVPSLVADHGRSGAPENHQTACNTFRISKDAFCEVNIRVNSVNGFCRQFHYQYS